MRKEGRKEGRKEEMVDVLRIVRSTRKEGRYEKALRQGRKE